MRVRLAFETSAPPPSWIAVSLLVLQISAVIVRPVASPSTQSAETYNTLAKYDYFPNIVSPVMINFEMCQPNIIMIIMTRYHYFRNKTRCAELCKADPF
jgi:hypothetical protein